MASRKTKAPPELDALVAEAQRRGYLSIKANRITYKCGREFSDKWSDPEERIRARCYAWLIIEKGYPPERIAIEVPVPRRVPDDSADIVLYKDDARRTPFLVVENKAGDRKLAIEQGFGNANSLRAEYMLADNGSDSVLFDVKNFGAAERQRNRVGNRDTFEAGYGLPPQFPLIAGGKVDIRSGPASELERRVRRVHALIWAGGKRDPLKSFDEWSKLLFAKVYDERMTPNGQPRRFQHGVGESKVQVANRVRQLFDEARRKDPTIFTEPFDLPDDKIADVVNTIQHIGLTKMDLDGLGHAFEHFFGSIFRGDLGQYFTRRELVRFVVSLLEPTDRDFVLDPTCGSGGFLLETLIQVWHYITANYAGQAEVDRKQYDFAHENLFGVEIHSVLGRVCQTNLLLHKDGHTNIEIDRSALDSVFSNSQLRSVRPVFTLIVGNPPFGDKVEEGDTDHLGSNELDSFELAKNRESVKSEFLIIERSMDWLAPGGRLGMVIPDGLLNNSGESSLCPPFRRYLLRNGQILAVVSLPDHAFRKAGAQNKTSLLFVRKFSEKEKDALDRSYENAKEALTKDDPGLSEARAEEEALRRVYGALDNQIFLAEADFIGYNPAGAQIDRNELYRLAGNGMPDPLDQTTILGQYFKFRKDPTAFTYTNKPQAMALSVSAILAGHPTYRMDPKFHLFRHERLGKPPKGMNRWRLGDPRLLKRREQRVIPQDFPDVPFKVLTLTQEGRLEDREAGEGNNPPAWIGQYFSDGSRWFMCYTDDLVFSQIDIWKGCVAIIPPEYDCAIFTQEFPIYEVMREELDPYYLRLMLRSAYLQRAIRAITTGHSNRRRTQETDFENLEVFLPEIGLQREIGQLVKSMEDGLGVSEAGFRDVLTVLDAVVVGQLTPDELIARVKAALGLASGNQGDLPDP